MRCTNRDGKGNQCRQIAPDAYKHCDNCRARGRKNRRRARLNPERAAFEQLINQHGFREDHPRARELAAWLAAPDQRCSICGVPNRFLSTLQRCGGPWPFFGDGRFWRRLQPDHIDPREKGSPHARLRPLCQGCNGVRGAGRKTDEQVLLRVRREWLRLFPERQLRWLR